MEVLNREQLSIVAEVTLSYRPKIRPSQRPIVSSSIDVYEVLKGYWNMDQMELRETFCVILLNTRNRVLGIVEISNGGFSSTIADIKMVFSVALKACASSIVVAHNHPSGSLKPSNADIMMTNRLLSAGKILELPVQDHLILSSEGYISLADEGFIR